MGRVGPARPIYTRTFNVFVSCRASPFNLSGYAMPAHLVKSLIRPGPKPMSLLKRAGPGSCCARVRARAILGPKNQHI